MSLVSFEDRDGAIWLDGKMLPWRDAKLHVLSHGLHYASTVFDGERVYNGKVFKLHEHTERLKASAAMLGIEMPYTVAEIERATNETIAANGIVDGYVRPIVWRGAEQMGVASHGTSVHVSIATWYWPSYFPPELREKGLRLNVSHWKRPHPDTAPTAAKAAAGYALGTIAKDAAEAAGFEDSVMLDWRGFLAETTGTNIFLAIDGKLHTPTPDCFLNGITRLTVIDMARKMGIEVIERHIPPEDLAKAQEMFLTGTAAEITPVGEVVGEKETYHFVPASMTKALIAQFDNLVGRTAATQAAQ